MTAILPNSLHHVHRGVPTPGRPVVWDMELPLQTNLNVIDRWIGHYGERLPRGAVIDEAALMVPSPWHVASLLKYFTERGWEHFNGARDLVYTNPFATRYFVEYNFLRHPDVGYRLEVMNLSQGQQDGRTGFSPLHASLWPDGMVHHSIPARQFPVPHLSFKVPDRRAYGLALEHLREHACIHAQTCQSTYGAFSYWIGNDTARQIYLKPRVNLRDAGEG